MVSRERRARLGRNDLLVAPLAEGKEERKPERAREEPRRNPHAHRSGAGHGAQDEPRRNHRHVNVRDALEEAGVGALHQGVDEYHTEAPCAVGVAEDEVAGEREAQGEHRKRGAHRIDLGDEVGGDRTVPLHRMQPIGVVVGHVVQQIERARHEGERRRPMAEDWIYTDTAVRDSQGRYDSCHGTDTERNADSRRCSS